MKRPDNISSKDWDILSKNCKPNLRMLKKINKNYPIQYLIGHVEFYGYKILVNKNVLIPRFETELLVEKVLQKVKKGKFLECEVLEIGTGSGCISVSLKNENPLLNITAFDISKKAIKIAKKNAELNNANINFFVKDMFKYNNPKKFDVIISNPPYIKKGDQIDPKTNYEPYNAIYADKEGLKYYYQIFDIAKKQLNKKFLIALEIDEDQSENLIKVAKKYFNGKNITVEKDLTNKLRFLFIQSE